KNNFANGRHHQDFLKNISDEVKNNSRAPFVRNFQENYEGGELPLYALVEIFSFGTLSKFYKNLNNIDKKNISLQFGVGYTFLESWIESLSYVRNICAHYGRLYNAKIPKTPILYKEYKEKGIGNNRIFASLICLKHIYDNDLKWNDFVDDLNKLISQYDGVNISTMGFSDNWIEILKK
ncbi:MAG: Abi family protein, partial [Lachnospiraceae bacterium]|nr:Abi family protein [Lachnospiraceae bacterium]